jgi:Amino acid permease
LQLFGFDAYRFLIDYEAFYVKHLLFCRPTFKYFSWHTSLVGLAGTSVMMFLISPVFAAVAILLCLSLVLALNFFSPARNANWGSISQALIFHQVLSIIMFLISPVFAAVAILLCLSLVLALNFFSPARNANWGSISQALIFHQVLSICS